MKTGFRGTIAKSLGNKYQLNKKAMDIRHSWDEVESMIKTVNKPKKK